ncbi:MAG: hypothetical protein ACR2LI_06025 [Propionibacteriaceae bacterium]
MRRAVGGTAATSGSLSGNDLAALSGATRELMGRMGQVSVDAALVYQHRTSNRDRAIADAMHVMIAGLAA